MSNITMMPPYVEPEHREFIETAESALEEYSDHLLQLIKKDLFDHGWNTEPHPDDVRKAERMFHEDPIRMHLIKHLAETKALFERPRFLITKTE